jgi:two-component system, OmpR family, sensor histidine kinase KdpD
LGFLGKTMTLKPPFENLFPRANNVWLRYLWGFLLALAATGLSFLLELDISPTNLVMIYLLAVVIAAIYLGRGPAILVSVLGVLAFDFFFIPPYFTLAVSQTEYLITFAGLFLVGMVISALAAQAREQAEAAQRREAETAALYALSRALAAADDLEAVLSTIRTHLSQTLGREVVINLGEQNLPGSIVLQTASRQVGALSIDLLEALSPRKRRLLEAFASQAAQAIERVQLAEQARQIKLLQAAEKLQNTLLNSISHDLRTPLVSITGALTTLENDSELASAARQSLVETAREEADRLNRLVGNLLDMTRLESGALQVKREECDVQDLVGSALGQMENRLTERQIRVEVASGLPSVSADFVLIVHVLINLLDNALKYSPEDSPLEIQARRFENEVRIAVLDRGLGIPAEDLGHVFDKFFRVQRPGSVAGTGLGLAICKGIIEAHGGRVWAAQREGGGTSLTFALPLEAQHE